MINVFVILDWSVRRRVWETVNYRNSLDFQDTSDWWLHLYCFLRWRTLLFDDTHWYKSAETWKSNRWCHKLEMWCQFLIEMRIHLGQLLTLVLWIFLAHQYKRRKIHRTTRHSLGQIQNESPGEFLDTKFEDFPVLLAIDTNKRLPKQQRASVLKNKNFFCETILFIVT